MNYLLLISHTVFEHWSDFYVAQTELHSLLPFFSPPHSLHQSGAWTACKVVKFLQTVLMILLVAAYALIGSLE